MRRILVLLSVVALMVVMVVDERSACARQGAAYLDVYPPRILGLELSLIVNRKGRMQRPPVSSIALREGQSRRTLPEADK
jgi:hypothetical protein